MLARCRWARHAHRPRQGTHTGQDYRDGFYDGFVPGRARTHPPAGTHAHMHTRTQPGTHTQSEHTIPFSFRNDCTLAVLEWHCGCTVAVLLVMRLYAGYTQGALTWCSNRRFLGAAIAAPHGCTTSLHLMAANYTATPGYDHDCIAAVPRLHRSCTTPAHMYHSYLPQLTHITTEAAPYCHHSIVSPPDRPAVRVSMKSVVKHEI